MKRWPFIAGILLAAPLAVLLTFGFGFDPVRHRAAQPLVHRQDGYAGAAACRSCHPDQHASWSRTFHRTMTQTASEESIRGAFDGREVRYAGRSARPFRENGRFLIEVPAAAGDTRIAEVALAVGSRRYQQYFERVERGDGFVLLRLPILWHIVEGRWLHMNTIFLFPDRLDHGTRAWVPDGWDRHRDRWNSNCILCHNTGPKPREVDFTMGQRDTPRRFNSAVAELGIACETCHGPGAAHVAAYDNPVRRYADYLSGDNDPRIVHPEKLGQEESVSLCGQCHGQRVPGDIAALLDGGPSYRPGDRLVDHVEPITLDTAWDRPEFEPRFWGDGTARLTAYEYQGVVQSPCYRRGELTCGSCHAMHGGDPRGMIEESKRGDEACLQCHGEIANDVRGHTHHEPESSGSRCLDCHMPRMVYGILEIHRSHRIENPDPRRDGQTGRPHACTLCHLDRSLEWSARRMTEMWGKEMPPPQYRQDGAPVDLADGLASLLAGDALQRATYARAMGLPGADVRPRDKAFMRAALGLTLGDPYASVRWLARRGLLALEEEYPIGLTAELAAWDHMDGSAASRGGIVDALREGLRLNGPDRLTAQGPELLMNLDFTEEMAMRSLCGLQSASIISIGE